MDEPKEELAELEDKENMSKFFAQIKERAKELPPNSLENTKPHVAAKALWMLSLGESVREVSRVTGVGHETARRLMCDHKETYEAQQKLAAVRYTMGAQEFVDRIFEWSEMAANDREMLKKISPDKLAMTAGILQDKALTLSGQATSVVEHRKGKSIEEALELIKAARERVAKGKVVEAEIVEDA